MKSILQRFGRELILVGAGQAVMALGSIVGVRLMTGALGPDVYGEVALAITAVTLINQLLTGPLSVALTRYFSVAQENGALPAFFGSAARLAIGSGLATVLLFAAGAVVLSASGYASALALAGFTLVFALVSGVNILLDSIQTAARQRAVVAWHQGVGQWVRYLSAVGLILALGRQADLALAGYAVSAALVLASQAFFFRRKFPTPSLEGLQPDRDWTRQLLRYALPFASWGIFTWLQLASDRWALQTFSDLEAVGFYTVLYQLGYYPLMMVSNVLVQFAQPVLFAQAGDGSDPERLARAQRNTRVLLAGALACTALAAAAAAWLHPFIFKLFAAPAYRGVSAFLPVMVLSGGLFACGQIATITHLNRGASKALLWPKVATAAAGTLLNIIGAYWKGLPGVVYAGAAFSALYLVWILAMGRPKSRNSQVE